MDQIRKLLRELENEISSEKFIGLYRKIREKYPPIKSYHNPQELIEFLHNQASPDYILNDRILSGLISEYRTDPNSNLISAYLLILFKPGLLKLFSQFRARARQFPSIGDVDLWLQIVTLFFEELNQIDLARDDKKTASKIIGRVRNSLRDYFRELFKSLTLECELKTDPESIFLLPAQISPQEIDELLQNLVELGVISETDKHILLATKVYGKSMKNLLRELKGMSYANIRQRKVRAEREIRRYIDQQKDKTM